MILAIDIGTTFLKIAVVDISGIILYSDKVPLTVISKGESQEVDSEEWLLGLEKLSAKIPKSLYFSIKGVVVSGNGPTLVPVDSEGTPLANAVLWMDERAGSLTEEIQNLVGEYIPPNFFLSRVYWFKKNRPEVYKNSSFFISCPEYVAYKLTGNRFTTLPHSGFTSFYWSQKKLAALELDPLKFPPFLPISEVYGNYKPSNILSDLPNGTPVICGGPDFLMSIIGSGSIESGILCDRTGTSEGLNLTSGNKNRFNDLRTLPHLVSGLYTTAGFIPKSGEMLLEGNPQGIVDEYKGIINKMKGYGLDISEIRIIGGHTKIKELNRLKSECFPFPVKIYPNGSELIGNGILGFVTLGFYASLQEACNVMVREEFCYNI